MARCYLDSRMAHRSAAVTPGAVMARQHRDTHPVGGMLDHPVGGLTPSWPWTWPVQPHGGPRSPAGETGPAGQITGGAVRQSHEGRPRAAPACMEDRYADQRARSAAITARAAASESQQPLSAPWRSASRYRGRRLALVGSSVTVQPWWSHCGGWLSGRRCMVNRRWVDVGRQPPHQCRNLRPMPYLDGITAAPQS